MGWQAGSGLGLSGSGRVDPVQANLFADRAGLGASKGVEATKAGEMTFAERMRDEVGPIISLFEEVPLADALIQGEAAL